MNNIKVSVIVPMYNSSKYISNTLNSILNQDFDSYEIILIDDGSTDNSLDIANEELKNSKIPYKIIHQKNSGVSTARNKGIETSQGEYIIFVDSDDYILTNHISQLYNGITDFSLTQLVKKEKNNVSNPYIYPQLEMQCRDIIKKELKMEMPFNFCQIMYKSSIIKQNNLKFNENVSYGEDTEFALKALSYGDKIAISNEITYFYIQHKSSLSNRSNFKRFDFIEVLENLKIFYKNKGLDDLAELITTSRIPKAIFGNMNYYFYNNYEFDKIMDKMDKLNLFEKLSEYQGDKKFKIKIKLFLFNPKLYYKIWKKFKNTI